MKTQSDIREQAMNLPRIDTHTHFAGNLPDLRDVLPDSRTRQQQAIWSTPAPVPRDAGNSTTSIPACSCGLMRHLNFSTRPTLFESLDQPKRLRLRWTPTISPTN